MLLYIFLHRKRERERERERERDREEESLHINNIFNIYIYIELKELQQCLQTKILYIVIAKYYTLYTPLM